MIRRWYKDRDFPEIKASNADVLLYFLPGQHKKAIALMTEHNATVDEIFELKEKLEKAKDALRFYAEQNIEVGEIAKQALKEIE